LKIRERLSSFFDRLLVERELEPKIPGPMTPTDFDIMKVLDKAKKPVPPRVVNSKLEEPKSQTTIQERLGYLVEKGFVERTSRGKYRLANPSRKYLIWPLWLIGALSVLFAVAIPSFGSVAGVIGLLSTSAACFFLYFVNWRLGRIYERRREE